VEIYGPDGNPISTSSGKLAVRATEIESLLNDIKGYIDGLEPAIGTPAADPVVQAHKDVVARAIDNIIDIVGAENIKLFLPLWETSGNKAYDLLDRSLQFDINGASFSTGGPFGNCLTLDGINDYLRQTPIAENASGGSFYNLTNPAYKIATRMAGFTGKIAAVQLNLKITGTINSAVLTASIYTDNSGVPGTLVATSNPLTCSQFPSVAHPVAFTFSTPYEVNSVSKYWIVLEYSTDTGVDESNYISWACEDMNTYGETMAIYDGANWNAQTGNCVFSVSNDALKCDADWTMIVACLPQNWSLSSNYTLYNGSSGKPISPTLSVYWQYRNQTIDWRFDNNGVIMGTANFPLISQNMFTIITQTFSKSASIGKSKLYVNNRLQASVDGTANVGNSLAGLLYLGVTQANVGGFSSYWKGRLGPVMLLSKELTIAEIDKVTSNLFALRKLGVAI
jgi:hypothetical protein